MALRVFYVPSFKTLYYLFLEQSPILTLISTTISLCRVLRFVERKYYPAKLKTLIPIWNLLGINITILTNIMM